MALSVLRECILQTRMRCHPVGLDVWILETLRLLPYFMCANSEGSGETAQMRRLAWAFAGRLLINTIIPFLSYCNEVVVTCLVLIVLFVFSKCIVHKICDWSLHNGANWKWNVTKIMKRPGSAAVTSTANTWHQEEERIFVMNHNKT